MVILSGTPNADELLRQHEIEELESLCNQMGLTGDKRELFIKNSLDAIYQENFDIERIQSG